MTTLNVKRFSLMLDGNKYVAANFQVKEFASGDGADEVLIDMDMVEKLQKIRNIGGRVTINSAYRTPSYNKAVGGASQSYHMKGMAFDITSAGLNLNELCSVANDLGIKGIIRYSTFVHVDGRSSLYHAFNSNGNFYLTSFKSKLDSDIDILKSKVGLSDETIAYLKEYTYGNELISKLAKAVK